MNTCDNLPEKLLFRWQLLYGEAKFHEIFKIFSIKRLPSFRVNTLKGNQDTLLQLEKDGFSIEKTLWYEDAYILKNKSVRELTETSVYKNGEIYIQNLSSMIPVLVLGPRQDEKILDLAAAPGSKTTQIAALMHNTGEITANDLSRQRLFKLRHNLTQAGVTNTKVLNLPGESFWKKLPEYFDKTLVDVPCTMEGRIQCDDPMSYKDWSPKKIKQLAKLQKFLLRSAVSATKVGGTIVYSTCTLSPEENEEVIEWILEKTNSALELESIQIPSIPFVSGLREWNNKVYPNAHATARILPDKNFEGFFIAKLFKKKTTI